MNGHNSATENHTGSNIKETSVNDITLEVCVNEDEDVGNVLV